MKIKSLDFFKTYNNEPMVIALGFFDSLHLGHMKLIDEVHKLSNKLNAKPAIFTFKGNPHRLVQSTRLEFFTFKERLRRYQNLGIDYVISMKATKSSMSLVPDEFLNILINNFNIKAIVTGDDFRYGRKAVGNTSTLNKFALQNNIEFSKINLFKDENKIKYSTSNIEKLLQDGKVDIVNALISENYSISGKVVSGRQIGVNNGIPTANINIKNKTVLIAAGVYKTYTIIGRKKYLSITNVGIHPTFNDNVFNVENHILNFNENIYGKYIRIEFIKKIRDIIKFDTVNDLYKQINKDIEQVRNSDD